MKSRKIYTALLTSLLAFHSAAAVFTVPAAVMAAEETVSYSENGITYHLHADTNTASVATDQTTGASTVVLPDSITADGVSYTVDTIEANAFNQRSSLTSITFPSGLKTIDGYAFRGSGLRSVSIPASLETLGMGIFEDCTRLSQVDFQDGLLVFGDEMFMDCTALQSVSLPDSLTRLARSCFNGCTSLTSVKLPKALSTIPYYGFAECRSLASIDIPETVTELEGSAFINCTRLQTITLPPNLTRIGQSALSGLPITNITIPDTVTRIDVWAFNSCTNLISVDLPDGLTKLGSGTFSKCSNLSHLTLGKSLKQFDGIGEKIPKLKSLVLPDSVTVITDNAFDGLSLTSLTLPANLEEIGEEAFADLDDVNFFSLPESVNSIDKNAFASDDVVFLEHRSDPDAEIDWGKLNAKVVIYGTEDAPYLWLGGKMTQYRSLPKLTEETDLTTQPLRLYPVYHQGLQVKTFTEENPGYTVQALNAGKVYIDGEEAAYTVQADGSWMLNSVYPGHHTLHIANEHDLLSGEYTFSDDNVSSVSMPVVYYLKNLEGQYEETERETITAFEGDSVTAALKQYPGFEVNTDLSILSTTASSTGELKVYYDRIALVVSFEGCDDIPAVYGQTIQAPQALNVDKKRFAAWMCGNLSLQPGDAITVTESMRFSAVYEDIPRNPLAETLLKTAVDLADSLNLYTFQPVNKAVFQEAWQRGQNLLNINEDDEAMQTQAQALNAAMLSLRRTPDSSELEKLEGRNTELSDDSL